jgi:hypothetical protein
MILGIIAAICIIAAFGFLGLYFKKKNEEEEKKGFVVIAGTVLFVYLFPSAALFIIGAVCLLILLASIL